MNVVYPQCCGLDVHKKIVVACLLTEDAQGERPKEIRSFTTMTADLLAMSDWLKAAGCTTVAMESTGVFWRPISHGIRNELLVSEQKNEEHGPLPSRRDEGRSG